MSRRLVIISPCRDEEQFVRFTLNSVVNQTVRPDLWLIVDDGSRDRTAEIVAGLRRGPSLDQAGPAPAGRRPPVGPRGGERL